MMVSQLQSRTAFALQQAIRHNNVSRDLSRQLERLKKPVAKIDKKLDPSDFNRIFIAKLMSRSR